VFARLVIRINVVEAGCNGVWGCGRGRPGRAKISARAGWFF
jgi:hypothetical protein